jgi:hypothetical protein
MDINMLRKALWVFLRPLVQLISNLVNPEIGDEWLLELKKFLRKEPCWTVVSKPALCWHELNGVIYFSVTSDGTTGEEWITRHESKGSLVSDYAKQLLRSSDFKPTIGVTTEVAVLKGMLFEDNDRTIKTIRAKAIKLNLSKPNAELACLIREKFTDEEIKQMGLWRIIAMHEPIDDFDGYPSLLGAIRHDDGRWLNAYYDKPDNRWNRESGFAFCLAS